MKVLVTGHLGFVGEATCEYLEEKGIDVIGFDIMEGLDIRKIDFLTQVVDEKRPERILHLAALARFSDSDKDPKLAFETNVIGTKNVVEVAQRYSIPLVYASTGSVYMPITKEPPITEEFPAVGNSVYGCTKALGEIYVREYTPHIILRYAHLYGQEKRGHGLVGGFLERIERGLEPELYGGKQSNDFTYIKDIARANYLALTASWDKWNQTYNIGSGEEITAEEAGRMVCEVVGYEGEIKVKEARTVDPQRFVFDISKAKKMLGYEPEHSFREGLKDMFKGVKETG